MLSYNDVDKAELIGARVLPAVISNYSGIVRWIIVGLVAFFTLLDINRHFRLISKPVYFFFFFYVFQLCYAIADGVDYTRFFVMSLMVFTFPIYFTISFRKNGGSLLNVFSKCIYIFILFSIVMNGHVLLQGKRFFGFMNNPNLYAMTALFWLVILLINVQSKLKKKKKIDYIFIFILILTIILSGSRVGLAGTLAIFGVSYIRQLNKFLLLSGFFIIVIIVINYFIDLDFILTRLLNIISAAEDTGRDDTWQKAYPAIERNKWWGNGLDANYTILNTGNVHNSYIRFFLNMGIVFTTFTLLSYIFSLFKIYRNITKIPLPIFGFILAFTLANYGEDFFVGLGSSVFIYVLVIYGLINFYITQDDATFRRFVRK